jgi:hypothetical protein
MHAETMNAGPSGPPTERTAPDWGAVLALESAVSAMLAFISTLIWALTGAGYFWPMWPLVWFGFIALMRGGHTRVTGNTRRT